MKSAEEWLKSWDKANVSQESVETHLKILREIQADAFKAGHESTMKWVGEECRRQTEKLIGLQQKPEPLF